MDGGRFGCLLLVSAALLGKTVGIEEEVARFVRENGAKFASVIGVSREPASVKLMKLLSKDRYTRFLRLNETASAEETKVFVYHDGPLEPFLEEIASTRIKSSILAITCRDGRELFLRTMPNVNHTANGLFYLATFEDNVQPRFDQVIVLNGNRGFAISGLVLGDDLAIAEESYDFGGMEVRSNSLTWRPYLTLEDCNARGTNCSSTGLLQDIAVAAAEMSNFSLVSHRDRGGDWGLRPVSGNYSLSGTWDGGSMADVINGIYDMSLSAWIWNLERNPMLDFVPTALRQIVLAMEPRWPEVDLGLFVRPFTDELWQFIGIGVVFITVSLAAMFAISGFKDTTGLQVARISAWMFFVVLEAYYEGALTMFFSSEFTVPFETQRDVIRAYPRYKLMMQDGNDIRFETLALQGDPDYADFWWRVENLPEETVFGTIDEGLDRIFSGPFVMDAIDTMIRSHFLENPSDDRSSRIRMFGSQYGMSNVIFAKNSPAKPAFDLACKTLRENGIMNQLQRKWVGPELKAGSAVEKTALAGGHFLLIYLAMGSIFTVVLIVFVSEVAYYKLLSALSVAKRRRQRAWNRPRIKVQVIY